MLTLIEDKIWCGDKQLKCHICCSDRWVLFWWQDV